MNKYILRGAIIGGVWGLASGVFVVGETLLPKGYSQFFEKATDMHWLIYFPGMISGYADYHSILGNRIGVLFILLAIFVGALLGILFGYLYGKFKK